METIKLGLVLITFSISSASLFAADGSIKFRGMIVKGTCTTTITSGVKHMIGEPLTTLAANSTSALNTAGKTVGQTALAITLNGGVNADCINNGRVETPYLDPELSKIDSIYENLGNKVIYTINYK